MAPLARSRGRGLDSHHRELNLLTQLLGPLSLGLLKELTPLWSSALSLDALRCAPTSYSPRRRPSTTPQRSTQQHSLAPPLSKSPQVQVAGKWLLIWPKHGLKFTIRLGPPLTLLLGQEHYT